MNKDVQKIIARILQDIRVEMTDEFDRNFERQHQELDGRENWD